MIYFIGLGGSGLRTVSEIAKIYKDAAPGEYMFSYVDTSDKTYHQINHDYGGQLIKSHEFVDLGAVIPYQAYDTARKAAAPTMEQQRILQWSLTPDEFSLPNYSLRDGATAQRIVGRYAITGEGYMHLKNKLQDNLKNFNTKKDADKSDKKVDVDIWVVSSSCGGTGSSILIDVLYLLNKLTNDVEKSDPNIKLALYMPKPFMDANQNNNNHPLNGYSTLWEIDNFRTDAELHNSTLFDSFAAHPVDSKDDLRPFPMYKFMIPIDSETNMKYKLTLNQLYPTVARMIYYITYGNAGNSIRDNLCNDLVTIKPKNGHTRSLIGCGFRAMRKANDELKEYMSKRGAYEVLSYGLLGEGNNADMEQEKVKFANENILSYLMKLEMEEGKRYTMVDGNLESKIEEKFPRVELIEAKKLKKDTMASNILAIEGVLTAKSIDVDKGKIYDTICNKIDNAINTVIIENGLAFAGTLLNVVDDFYLEVLAKDKLRPELTSIMQDVEDAKRACQAWNGKDKNLGLTYLTNYKSKCVRYMTLNAVLNILDRLTQSGSGYLEVLRNGDGMSVTGIAKIVDPLSAACMVAKKDYDNLAIAFRNTDKDAMTIYLPSLSRIAKGKGNSNWAEDNFFENLYHLSILNREKTRNVPVHQSENNLGLNNILSAINQANSFISLIKNDPINGVDIQTTILDPMNGKIKTLVEREGSAASKWINVTLEKAIEGGDNRLLPDGMDNFDMLCDSFANEQSIPYFYPTEMGSEPAVRMRLVYVGSNEQFAKDRLHFEDGGMMQFVSDPTMTNQIVIMRMPIGLTIPAYAYYNGMRTRYYEHIDEIEEKKVACHIHQAFNEDHEFERLRLRVGMPELIGTAESLVKSLYYQHVTDLLKEQNPQAYERIFGFPPINAVQEERAATSATSEDDDWTGDSSANATKKQVTNAARDTTFISLKVDKEKNEIKLMARKVSVDRDNNNLVINGQEVCETFSGDKTLSCANFVAALAESENIRKSHLSAGEHFKAISGIQEDRNLYSIMESVKAEAKRRLREIRWNNELQFYAYVRRWTNLDAPDDRDLIRTIESTINNL